MRYIEAFSASGESIYTPAPGEVSLFLAGGISNCPDWQVRVTEQLAFTDLVVLNPRRADFPMDDPAQAKAQIEWEHHHLNLASGILFWFPEETLCPITLFEYGKWLCRQKPLFVGCHPGYKRSQDVVIQTALERPFQTVFTDLDEVVGSTVLQLSPRSLSRLMRSS